MTFFRKRTSPRHLSRGWREYSKRCRWEIAAARAQVGEGQRGKAPSISSGSSPVVKKVPRRRFNGASWHGSFCSVHNGRAFSFFSPTWGTGRWASALRPQILLLSGELGLDCRSRCAVPQHPVSVWTLCPWDNPKSNKPRVMPVLLSGDSGERGFCSRACGCVQCHRRPASA